jgi:hypothetical protein
MTVLMLKGASTLVRQNIRVALVEAGDLTKVQDWSMPSDMFSNRVSSLTNASQSFLNGMIQSVDLLARFLIMLVQQPSALGILLRRRGRAPSSRCRYRLSDFN